MSTNKNKHKFILNNQDVEFYSMQDCIASIRCAWAWGYFETASIDNIPVDASFLRRIGCGL